jgi:hypothetical protein
MSNFLPQLQGRKRSIVWFVIGLIALIMTGTTFFVTRQTLALGISVILLVFTLWYGYKAFGGED